MAQGWENVLTQAMTGKDGGQVDVVTLDGIGMRLQKNLGI